MMTHILYQKQHYTIENFISFGYDDDNIAERQRNVTLLANSPSSDGNCTLIPFNCNETNKTHELGVIDYNGAELQLFNQYEIFCDRCFDPDVGKIDNFIYDGVVFLNAFYNKSPNTTTIVGSGKHSIEAIISDEHSLAACFSMDVIAPETIFDNITTNISFSEIIDIYELLASGVTNTADWDSDSHTLIDQSVVTNLLYGIVGTNSNITQTQQTQNNGFAELQMDLIGVFLDAVNNQDTSNGTSHANVLSVVSKTTTNVMPTNESDIIIYNSNSLIVLTSMNDRIVPNLGIRYNVDSYVNIVMKILIREK